MPKKTTKKKRLSIQGFVFLAIDTLKSDKSKKKIIHTVWSGFNSAFRKYFPGKDPVAEVKKLVDKGKLSFRIVRGGALIGRPDVIKPIESTAEKALWRMGL